MNSKDYYQVLDIERNSSEEEIKKAYRRLSFKYHPDRQNSLDNKKIAEKKMAEINQAYQILSNKEKRQNYDRYGSGNAFQRNSHSTGGFQTSSSDFSDFFQDIFDIFGNKGGGFQWKKKTQFQTESRSHTSGDIHFSIELTFQEFLFGTKKEVSLNVEKYCRECREKMGLHFPSHVIECSNCKGKGVIKTQSFFGILSSTCPQCQGQGGRFRTEKKVIKFSIPKGTQNNVRLCYRGVGNDSWDGKTKSDVYITIKVKENSSWTQF